MVIKSLRNVFHRNFSLQGWQYLSAKFHKLIVQIRALLNDNVFERIETICTNSMLDRNISFITETFFCSKITQGGGLFLFLLHAVFC